MSLQDTLEHYTAELYEPAPEAGPLLPEHFGSFTPEELKVILDQTTSVGKRIDMAMAVYDSEEPRYGDFIQFAAQHYKIPEEGLGNADLEFDEQGRTPYARIRQAISEYGQLQHDVRTIFADPELDRAVSDDEWRELIMRSPRERAAFADDLQLNHIKVRGFEANPDLTDWAKKVADTAEQQALNGGLLEKAKALSALDADYQARLQRQAEVEALKKVQEEARLKLRYEFADELDELKKQQGNPAVDPSDAPTTEFAAVPSTDPETTFHSAQTEAKPEEPATDTNAVTTEHTGDTDSITEELDALTSRAVRMPWINNTSLGALTVTLLAAAGISHATSGPDTEPKPQKAQSPLAVAAPPQTIITTPVPEVKVHKPKPKKEHTKVEVVNPVASLGRIVAGDSMVESGIPSDPTIVNPFGYKGWLQMSPYYWRKGWAKEFLGNAKAPMTVDNMAMAGIKMWKKNINSYGSVEAAAAAWLKGPATGAAIAGSNRTKYEYALNTADGNNTTVEDYMQKVTYNAQTVNIHKQLPWLAGVMKRHPKFDWSLLDKKYKLYSKQHMHDRFADARTEAKIKGRIQLQKAIVKANRYEYKINGNKQLEYKQNVGPQVQKYSRGQIGAWCSWYVTWVYGKAGYPLTGGPGGKTGSMGLVRETERWFKIYGQHFSAKSKHMKPRPADVIFYGDEHIGIVDKVRGDVIETIEGNTSPEPGKFEAEGGTVARKFVHYKDYPPYPYPRAIRFGRIKNPDRQR